MRPNKDAKGPAPEDPSVIGEKAIAGGVWAFAQNMANRGLGVIRTIVLARLLSPDDFGLLGLALLATAALETISQTGFHGAIIQKQKDITAYLNTAWTCAALRGTALFALLVAFSPQVAALLGDPRIVPVLRVIGLGILVEGFTNTGVVYFKRELEFKKQFQYETLSNLADILVSLALAFWLRSVWALVAGGLAGHLGRFILSYRLHPWRPAPAIDMAKLREMFAFGKWMLAAGALHFLITKADDLFVGTFYGAAVLGLYQMAFLLSNATTTDLSHVISQIAFPAYSKMQTQISKLSEAYLKVLRGVAFASALVAVGLFGFGRELVDWLLGDQWAAMVPTLEILALAGLARSIQSTAVPVFMATGRPKVHTEINTLRAVVLCALIYPFSKTWGVPGVACAVLASCLVSLLGVSWRIHRVLEVRPGQFCVSIIAPVLAALTALALVAAFKPAGAELETGRLCALLLAGAAAYLALSLAADRVLKFGLLETARGAWRQLDFWRSSRLAKAGRPR